MSGMRWGWLAALPLLAAGMPQESDGVVSNCAVMLQAPAQPETASEEPRATTESVTLLVRGMLKSRSGAT